MQKLVDMLDEKSHLPAVLQSLGCIAQTAMPVFETREKEIEQFIKKNILELSHVCLLELIPNYVTLFTSSFSIHLKANYSFQTSEGKAKESWEDRSEICSMKVRFQWFGYFRYDFQNSEYILKDKHFRSTLIYRYMELRHWSIVIYQ